MSQSGATPMQQHPLVAVGETEERSNLGRRQSLDIA